LRQAEAGQFVAVEVRAAKRATQLPPVAPSKAIEIRPAGGRSLVVEPGFDAAHLRAFLAVLDALGEGGPTVTIATSDGEVTVRRSSVAPPNAGDADPFVACLPTKG